MLNGMLVVLMAVGGTLEVNDLPFAWMSLGTDSGSYQMFIDGEEILFGVEDNPVEKEEGESYYLLNGGIKFSSIQALFFLEIEVLEEKNISVLLRTVMSSGGKVSTYKYVLN